jgi:serine/threonine protein kinase
MSQVEPSQLPLGTVVNGRYRVIRPVGQGGLGTVYQVTDVLYGRHNVYALKEQWDQSKSARKQFAREGAWLKQLDHRNIPKVVEHFEWNGRLYLVMNFVDGENLEQKLERAGGRPLPELQVISWILPICDALHYLHMRTPPIIHRDVKPSNIIVTATGHPVLVDLGIAKEHVPGANATATFVRKAGTEGYAPPEQYAAAGQAGPWSDVYGLGATLYQLLTTQIPPTAVERVALDARLRRPSELNPTVSPLTDAAILRALAIRPQDRFQSMVEVKRALEAALAASSGTGAYPSMHGSAPFSAPFSVAAAAQWSPPPDSSELAARPAARAPRTPVRTAGPLSARASTTPRHPSHPRVTQGPSATPSTDVATEGRRRLLDPTRPLVWGAAVAIAVLVVAAVAVSILRSYAPLDRSTPRATVVGYFTALQAQNYSRAWQYTAASNGDQSSEVGYAQNLQADDAHNGRVLSFQVGAVTEDSVGHSTCAVTVLRAGAPNTPIVYNVVLTQYNSLWLIDHIS